MPTSPSNASCRSLTCACTTIPTTFSEWTLDDELAARVSCALVGGSSAGGGVATTCGEKAARPSPGGLVARNGRAPLGEIGGKAQLGRGGGVGSIIGGGVGGVGGVDERAPASSSSSGYRAWPEGLNVRTPAGVGRVQCMLHCVRLQDCSSASSQLSALAMLAQLTEVDYHLCDPMLWIALLRAPW